jgi:predicted nuclease of predicted toxin-antitoxin system
LREAGYDVVSVAEVERKGISDEDVMAWAIVEHRAVVTHNAQDFAPLAKMYYFQQMGYSGISIVRQFEKDELLRRVLALLEPLSAEDLTDTLRFA